MAHKDPFYYYLILPIALLIIQLVVAVLAYKIRRVVLVGVGKLQAHFTKDNSDYRILTRKEAEMRAHKHERERIAANHSILTQQGSNHDHKS